MTVLEDSVPVSSPIKMNGLRPSGVMKESNRILVAIKQRERTRGGLTFIDRREQHSPYASPPLLMLESTGDTIAIAR